MRPVFATLATIGACCSASEWPRLTGCWIQYSNTGGLGAKQILERTVEHRLKINQYVGGAERHSAAFCTVWIKSASSHSSAPCRRTHKKPAYYSTKKRHGTIPAAAYLDGINLPWILDNMLMTSKTVTWVNNRCWRRALVPTGIFTCG
jgi:hypothetical protein